jgi:aryl-alcohol dehydrogenase-like predicted oxidoreductase
MRRGLHFDYFSPSNHDVKVFMTAAKAAVEAGKVKAVGLSEVSAPKIREVSTPR